MSQICPYCLSTIHPSGRSARARAQLQRIREAAYATEEARRPRIQLAVVADPRPQLLAQSAAPVVQMRIQAETGWSMFNAYLAEGMRQINDAMAQRRTYGR